MPRSDDPYTESARHGVVVPIPTEPPEVAKYAEPVELTPVVEAYGYVTAEVNGAVTSEVPL